MANRKPSPYEAFRDNIADAEALMNYARAFNNRRRDRRMRQELRNRVGDALNVRSNQRDDLDCLESDDLFVVFMPGGNLGREHFIDLRPLLRQAIVAACAALETYVADKAMDFVSDALAADKMPKRMQDISLTVGHWAEIEEKYVRRQWGIRPIIWEHIQNTSSTAPSNIGIVLSTIGVTKWADTVDDARGIDRKTTVKELDAITKRRNQIAHTADRKGRGRASLEFVEVQQHIETIKDVVDALEGLLTGHSM